MSDELQAVPRRALSQEVWDRIATDSSDAWLWHRWDLCEALATWPDVTDQSFALLDTNGEIAAIVPLRRTQYRRARMQFSRLDSLGGPAIVEGCSSKNRRRRRGGAIEEITRLGRAARDVEAHIALSPLSPRLRAEDGPRVNPLLELGLADTSTQTWIVDVSGDAESLRKGMKERARRMVRKAENAGIEVRFAEDARDLDTYYRLHRANYSRTGATPHPRAYFEAIWSHFIPSGHARIMSAELDGEVLAMRNFGVDKEAAVYWTGAGSDRALETGANHLLQLRGMEWMLECGIGWSETGEAFPAARDGKAKGLSYFKESFGGRLMPFFRGRIDFRSRLYTALDGLSLIKVAASR